MQREFSFAEKDDKDNTSLGDNLRTSRLDYYNMSQLATDDNDVINTVSFSIFL